MLFQELGKMKRSWIMSSLMLIALGIVMILCPVRYMGLMISALGYVLLVLAAVLFLEYLSGRETLMDHITLVIALAVGVLGLFVLVYRRDVLPTLGLIAGLFLVIKGLIDMFDAFVYARRAGHAAWGFLAILSIFTILLGLSLLWNPWWNTPSVMKRVIGYMLLFTSAVSIIRTIITWPFKSE